MLFLLTKPPSWELVSNPSSTDNNTSVSDPLQKKMLEFMINQNTMATNEKTMDKVLIKKCDMQYVKPVNIHHTSKSAAKNMKCLYCNRWFNDTLKFEVHQQTHTNKNNEKNKRYSCDICQKTFSGSSSLVLHLKRHRGERQFKCEECGKEFSQNGHLKRHLKLHSGQKDFKCNLCSKEFVQSHHLTEHMRTHSNEKTFRCEYCNKQFKHLSGLRHHLKTHTESEAFKCEICDKYFSQKGHLKNHLRIHSKEKPYECDFCHRKFTQNCNLKKHKVTHFGGDKKSKCDMIYDIFYTS